MFLKVFVFGVFVVCAADAATPNQCGMIVYETSLYDEGWIAEHALRDFLDTDSLYNGVNNHYGLPGSQNHIAAFTSQCNCPSNTCGYVTTCDLAYTVNTPVSGPSTCNTSQCQPCPAGTISDTRVCSGYPQIVEVEVTDGYCSYSGRGAPNTSTRRWNYQAISECRKIWTGVCNTDYYETSNVAPYSCYQPAMCTSCPSFNSVAGKSTFTGGRMPITNCYIPANTSFSDSTGTYVFTSNCHHS